MHKILLRTFLVILILSLGVWLNKIGFLEKTLSWIEGFGVWGPAVFLSVYIISCIFFIPSVVFAFSSGILFGVGGGACLSLLGIATGSLFAFWIGRYLAHDFVERKIERSAEFQKLAVALERRGWKVIMLARFSPVFPFTVGNYAFGLTRIKAMQYFLASLVGSIPSTFVYAYAGHVTGSLSAVMESGRQRSAGEWGLLVFGLLATVLLAWYLRRIAEKDLRSD